MQGRVQSIRATRLGGDVQAAMARRGKILTDNEAEQLTQALLDLVRHDLLEPAEEANERKPLRLS
jgi:hypothetical protein